jgi:hypothetical protein
VTDVVSRNPLRGGRPRNRAIYIDTQSGSVVVVKASSTMRVIVRSSGMVGCWRVGSNFAVTSNVTLVNGAFRPGVTKPVCRTMVFKKLMSAMSGVPKAKPR